MAKRKSNKRESKQQELKRLMVEQKQECFTENGTLEGLRRYGEADKRNYLLKKGW